jgi:acetyl esterase/lipase
MIREALLMLAMSLSAAVPYGTAPQQVGDLLLPAEVTKDTPKLLLIHGGGWRSDKYQRDTLADEAKLFCDAGYAVYNIDYRLAPEAAWPAIGDDCLAAARKFVSCDGMPELSAVKGKPISILGASAGGHLAIMTGLRLPRADVLGVISVSGIADPAPDAAANPDRYKALFAGGPIVPEAFPESHLKDGKGTPPVLFTHCWNDTVVPIESQITLARAMTDKGLHAETYFYDFERKGQGHAIWNVADKTRHVFYRDIHERCLRFLRGVRGLPEPLPGGASFPFLGKLRDIPAAEVRQSGVSIGFECLDRDLFDPELCYDQIAAIGVKNARVQTGWWKCEREKGVYDWTWLDGIVSNLASRGINVWFNVGFGNKLYMEDTFGEASVGFVPIHYGPECEEAWRIFCRALAKHFKGRVDHFEIWNEANGKGFWRPKDPEPVGYARLIKITADAIREEQPEARCGACVMGFPQSYLQELKKQGALAKLDFFSLHPYDPVPEQYWPSRVAWLRDLFRGAGRGGRDVEVWQGESGFASWTPEKYWQPRSIRESERAQAVWLLRRFVLDFSLGLELSSYFQTADMMKKSYQMGASEQGARKVARQGVLNGLTYTPKPSYRALASIAAVFRDGVRHVEGRHFKALQGDVDQQSGSDALKENDAVRCVTFARGRTPYYFYYMPADPQKGWTDKTARTTLEISLHGDLDLMREPVLVNMLTGDVFACGLRGTLDIPDTIFVDNLPLSDTPLLVCDRSAIDVEF